MTGPIASMAMSLDEGADVSPWSADPAITLPFLQPVTVTLNNFMKIVRFGWKERVRDKEGERDRERRIGR